MMGRLDRDQGQLFCCFNLEEAVPGDHQVRRIAGVLDLSWVHTELASHYSHLGRPSIDPVLMIRMLIVGYAFAIRSERALCRELQVNLAYRWFCGLGLEDRVPDHSVFSRARNERFRDHDIFRQVFERVVVTCIKDRKSTIARNRCWQGLMLMGETLNHPAASEKSAAAAPADFATKSVKSCRPFQRSHVSFGQVRTLVGRSGPIGQTTPFCLDGNFR
jgi:transposase